MKVRANGIDIEVEDSDLDAAPTASGVPRPVVLLIMGLGMQLIAWPPQLVQALVEAGYRVLRMDNRDVGLSQHFDHLGKPNIVWAGIKYKLGLPQRPPYTVNDMAADAVGVLDALGVARAHIVGVSMGGMIAQRVAIRSPERVLSLTSIMSSSGAKGLPQARREVTRAMISRPANNTQAAVVAHYIKLFKTIGSPDHPTPEPEIRDRIVRGIVRSFHPVGTLRQMLAIVSDTDRANQLPRVTSPTLVLHGAADPLVPHSHGEDTARRIPGARLISVAGMGHDLPPEPVRQMLEALIPHLQAADKVALRRAA